MVGDDDVAHLSCQRIVDVESVVGTHNHVAVAVGIHSAHSVVRHVVVGGCLSKPSNIVFLVGHESVMCIVANESVGAAKPHHSVRASVDKV